MATVKLMAPDRRHGGCHIVRDHERETLCGKTARSWRRIGKMDISHFLSATTGGMPLIGGTLVCEECADLARGM